jgi:hypothetical protein
LFSLVDFFQCTFIAGFRNNVQDHRRVQGTAFRDTGGYQKAGTSSLKRVTGRNFTLVSDFIEASRNIYLDFLHKKTTKKL